MKVLILNGSPKNEKSNTLRITNAFADGMNAIMHNDVDIIHISKYHIEHCTGCYACWTKTPGECVFNDDMKMLIEKYADADVVIWSFPLYYFSMPSKIKAFLDRLLPMNYPDMEIVSDGTATHPERFDLSHQKYVLISTCGFPTIENNYEALFKQFDILYADYTKIICPEGELFKVPQLSERTGEYLSYVKTAGEEYIRTERFSEDTQKKLEELLYPKEQFVKMANASWERNDKEEKRTGAQTKDASLNFMTQMSAIYNPKAYEKDSVLEMYFTDLDKRYQLLIQKDACTVLTKDFKEYTTRIETTFELWKDISAGKIDGSQAMVERKYKVKGDLNTMLIMDELFGTSRPVSAAEDNMKTNMQLLFYPFITLWIGIPIDTFYGGIAGILVSALALAFGIKYKLTVYDKLSMISVILLGIMGITAFNQIFLVCLSYLIFGVMWIASGFTKIPLSAYYSAYNYGGKKAFENPLFMKTNKILTQAWGIVYIIASITSYFLLNSAVSSYTSLLNKIIPLIMGIFTVWFQKWYPSKIARG